MNSAAKQFAQLWEELGNMHEDLSEEDLITKEEQLFKLKKKLTLSDVPYIFEHTSPARMIQKELMHFLGDK